MNKILAAFLGISIAANIILGLMYVGQKTMVAQAQEKNIETNKQINQLKSESHLKEKALHTFQQNEAYYEIEHNQEIKSFIDETFRELFNYNNQNYSARFDRVHNILSGSVISKLKASGEKGSAQIEFENEVKSLNVYLTAIDKKQSKALVEMETQYSVGGSQFPRRNQIFEVTLVQDGTKWVVDKLELMGAFQPFEEN